MQALLERQESPRLINAALRPRYKRCTSALFERIRGKTVSLSLHRVPLPVARTQWLIICSGCGTTHARAHDARRTHVSLEIGDAQDPKYVFGTIHGYRLRWLTMRKIA